MIIAIHGIHAHQEFHADLQDMLDFLGNKEVDLLIFDQFAQQLEALGLVLPEHKRYKISSELKQARFLFSIGGDGTILDSVTYVKNKGIPIFGINMGRLGFLTAVQGGQNLIHSLERLFNRDYLLEERSLVHVDTPSNTFGTAPFALNECAVLKTDSSSMIKIKTYLNGAYLNAYNADGLIVSTPTGSTGYNLSCGGPVVFPQSGNFVITPVCPHNLNVRPLVVPQTVKISLEVESRSNTFLLSLDSRSIQLPTSETLIIRQESFKVNLVKLRGNRFVDTLRAKLNWGLDNRNSA